MHLKSNENWKLINSGLITKSESSICVVSVLIRRGFSVSLWYGGDGDGVGQ